MSENEEEKKPEGEVSIQEPPVIPAKPEEPGKTEEKHELANE